MTITIQKTSKRIKAHLFLATTALALGLILLTNKTDNDAATIGGFLTIIGLLWLICAKIAKWWNHS